MSTPYIGYVPKDIAKNLRWRQRVRRAAHADLELQADLKQACFEDVLFFFNFAGWCYEPRASWKVRPFVTWPHQDPAIVAMDEAITHAEETEEPTTVVADKSRGQGATWIFLLVFLRRWLRDPLFTAGVVTRNEKLVDSLRNPDALMWKIGWELEMLPRWLLPKGWNAGKHRSLTDHSILNPETGATIVGEAATGDIGRGGRRTVWGLDEFGAFAEERLGIDYKVLDSVNHNTNCKIIVSTHHGDQGAYYEIATEEPSTSIKVILDWKDNPTQNRLMYRYAKGLTFAVRNEEAAEVAGYTEACRRQGIYDRLSRRGFKLDGIRSPWYDAKCMEAGATPRGIAQELDRNPHGAAPKLFDSETIASVKAKCCLPPLLRGRLVYDSETLEMRPPYVAQSDSGELRLWVQPDSLGQMPRGKYKIGIDISSGTAGTHTSNSVACVINTFTGEQVAEWVSNAMIPSKFAQICAILGHWFDKAELIPEANFGAGFLRVLIDELAYPNLYYRENEIEGIHKKTKKPGFWTGSDDIKFKLLEQLQIGMAEGAFTPRSKELLEECPEYEWKNGRIVHVGSARTTDEGSKGKAHGDRVIAAAIAWFGCAEDCWADREEQVLAAAPAGCMARRLQKLDALLMDIHGDPWTEANLDIFAHVGSPEYRDPWG